VDPESANYKDFPSLKIEAVCAFETSANFYQTARHYIPDDYVFEL